MKSTRTIALEEHYATTKFLNGPGGWHKSRPALAAALADVGDARIAAMDEAGVHLAVLSLAAPGEEQMDGPPAGQTAREGNSEAPPALRRDPERLPACHSPRQRDPH